MALDVGAWMNAALGTQGVDLLPIEPAIAVDNVRLPENSTLTPPTGSSSPPHTIGAFP